MTDRDIPTRDEAIDILTEQSGQGYLLARRAFDIMAQFADDLDAEYAAEWANDDQMQMVDPEADDVGRDKAVIALSEHLADLQRPTNEARGLVRAHAHQMVVTYSDVSDIIVSALGGEPGRSSAAGAGFSADERHEKNVAAIKDLLGDAADAEPADA